MEQVRADYVNQPPTALPKAAPHSLTNRDARGTPGTTHQTPDSRGFGWGQTDMASALVGTSVSKSVFLYIKHPRVPCSTIFS